MSMSMSMDMSNSMSMDRMASSEEDGTMSMDFGGRQVVDSVIADVEEEEGRPPVSPVFSLPDVVEAVVGSVRAIVEGALVGRPFQLGQTGLDGETFGALLRSKTTEEESQLAFITYGPKPTRKCPLLTSYSLEWLADPPSSFLFHSRSSIVQAERGSIARSML